jgi:hypothetical protein
VVDRDGRGILDEARGDANLLLVTLAGPRVGVEAARSGAETMAVCSELVHATAHTTAVASATTGIIRMTYPCSQSYAGGVPGEERT